MSPVRSASWSCRCLRWKRLTTEPSNFANLRPPPLVSRPSEKLPYTRSRHRRHPHGHGDDPSRDHDAGRLPLSPFLALRLCSVSCPCPCPCPCRAHLCSCCDRPLVSLRGWSSNLSRPQSPYRQRPTHNQHS